MSESMELYLGERRRRRAAERAAAAAEAPPLSRREMRARGILLTTEVPVVTPIPDYQDAVAAAEAEEAEAAVAKATKAAAAAQAEDAPGDGEVPEDVEPVAESDTGAEQAIDPEHGSEQQTESEERPEPAQEPESEQEPPQEQEAPQEQEQEPEPESEQEPELESEQEPEQESEAARDAEPAEPGTPNRRTLRDRLRNTQPPAVEAPSERTVTGRRPVVRTPTTARAVRSVDETGALSGLQSAVPAQSTVPTWAPTEAATPDVPPAAPPQPEISPVHDWTTSPASWESAVSMPGVVMGIEDVVDGGAGSEATGPTEGAALESAPSGAEGTPVEAPVPVQRQTLRRASPDESGLAGRAIPSTPARSKAPVEAPDWSAIVGESDAVVQGVMPASEAAEVPTRRSRAELNRKVSAEPAVAEGAGKARRGVQYAGALKIMALVAVGLAIGALIYLLGTGTLGSMFAMGGVSPVTTVAASAAQIGIP